MSAAIFGLIGVVVGGLLQGGWAWAMERRKEGWAAKRAGRLFGPSLYRCWLFLDHAIEHGPTWAEALAVINSNLDRWDEHALVLAGTLHGDDWAGIYAAVRRLEQMTWAAPDDADTRHFMPEDVPYLEDVQSVPLAGAMACSAVSVRGVSRQPLRRLWWRLQPKRYHRLVERLVPTEVPQPPRGS